ncbi:hypothetical protein KIW84_041950 [Lathyrus oleraceus]|uniref:Uncharacterized protein n=1 Tax=Pisum sativum TaxID=3888 RepID=A0A9D4X9R1_PEA|nr:hypothetical protein KIW84_041950 [Pisum sativum]
MFGKERTPKRKFVTKKRKVEGKVVEKKKHVHKVIMKQIIFRVRKKVRQEPICLIFTVGLIRDSSCKTLKQTILQNVAHKNVPWSKIPPKHHKGTDHKFYSSANPTRNVENNASVKWSMFKSDTANVTIIRGAAIAKNRKGLEESRGVEKHLSVSLTYEHLNLVVFSLLRLDDTD